MGSVDMGEYSNSNIKQNAIINHKDAPETDEDSENTKSDSVTDDKVNNVRFIESDSDDDEKNMFFMSCAENKVNAFIERMKEYRENFGRPEEFENEAVSMAIQQHGLKKYEDNICYDCNSDLSSSSFNMVSNLPLKNRRIREESNDSLETHHDDDKNDSDDEPSRSKKKKLQEFRYNHLNDCNFDFDNVSFLNQAVAVAIEKKGLSSSTCCNLK